MSFIDPVKQFALLKVIKNILVIEAIELRNDQEETFQYHALLLTRKKNEVAIEERLIGATLVDLEDWVKSTPKNIPALLLVNSDKLLHKIVNVVSGQEGILKDILPAANPDDFYTQSYLLPGNRYFASVVRKSYLAGVLEALGVIKERITNISIGLFPLFFTYRSVVPVDNNNTGQLSFENYSFVINDNGIDDYKIAPYKKWDGDAPPRHVSFGSERIPSELLMCYSYGIYYLTHILEPTGIDLPEIKNNEGLFIFNRLSKVVVAGAGSLVLLSLILSNVLFTIYNGKYDAIKDSYSDRQREWQTYQAAQSQQQKLQEVFQRNGITEGSNIAFYSDQLTCILPEMIYLRKLEIHPVNTRSLNENVEFISNRIVVDGNCYTSSDLNEWINNIKKYSWVRSVVIKNFKQNHGEELASFTIEILKEKV